MHVPSKIQAHVRQSQWVKDEMGGANFGDKRLTNRLVKMMSQGAGRVGASIHCANENWKGAKGAYRMLANRKVDVSSILEPHKKSIARRCAEEDVVLVVGDTTELNYPTRDMEGLGLLRGKSCKGLIWHSTLAVTPQSVPLGVLSQQVMKRSAESLGRADERVSRPIGEKESRKWLASIDDAEHLAAQLPTETKVVCVFDREADAYHVFERAIKSESIDLLVRARHDRCLVGGNGKKLLATLKEQPVAGTMTIKIPRQKRVGLKSKDSGRSDSERSGHWRKNKLVEAQVRFKKVTLKVAHSRSPERKDWQPNEVSAIHVTSQSRTKSEVVDWTLLTTLPVETVEDARRIVQWYACRWMIEIFFKVMKSGCKIESRQLRSTERLEKCLAIDSIIAWRVLYAVHIGRHFPNLKADVFFEEEEWQAIWIRITGSTDIPKEPPPLDVIIKYVGSLGGHLGRTGDGPPGARSLWLGFQVLWELTSFFTIIRKSFEKQATQQ